MSGTVAEMHGTPRAFLAPCMGAGPEMGVTQAEV